MAGRELRSRSVDGATPTAADLATRLSCREVEALAEMLRACGQVEAADLWIEEHANDDDAHHTERGSEQ